ncbi:MAG: metalloenzyme [bacterium]|nr:metalloenzyme [bacterium]
MRILYLFIDGIGFGQNDPDTNPFRRYAASYLSALSGISPSVSVPEAWRLAETDASMGFPGLPQSASGQTTLWTGTNGVRAMGRHKTGFPGPTLVRVLEQYSIIKTLTDLGRPATLLNAYTGEYLERIKDRPRLMSASSHLQRVSGQPFKNMDDLARGDALYMDVTHEIMHHLYPEMTDRFPVASGRQRGRDLVRMSRRYDLSIYEFFLTDKAGHDQDFELARWTITTLEEFLAGICEAIDPAEELLLVTSDHGNMEDLSTKTHTKNPVPTFVFGADSARIAGRIHSLMDIVPIIYEELGVQVKLPGPDENPDPREVA